MHASPSMWLTVLASIVATAASLTQRARASREASELSTVVATAGRLARRTPLRADFSSEKWTGGKSGRAEKLWHTMAAVALRIEEFAAARGAAPPATVVMPLPPA